MPFCRSTPMLRLRATGSHRLAVRRRRNWWRCQGQPDTKRLKPGEKRDAGTFAVEARGARSALEAEATIATVRERCKRAPHALTRRVQDDRRVDTITACSTRLRWEKVARSSTENEIVTWRAAVPGERLVSVGGPERDGPVRRAIQTDQTGEAARPSSPTAPASWEAIVVAAGKDSTHSPTIRMLRVRGPLLNVGITGGVVACFEEEWPGPGPVGWTGSYGRRTPSGPRRACAARRGS